MVGEAKGTYSTRFDRMARYSTSIQALCVVPRDLPSRSGRMQRPGQLLPCFFTALSTCSTNVAVAVRTAAANLIHWSLFWNMRVSCVWLRSLEIAWEGPALTSDSGLTNALGLRLGKLEQAGLVLAAARDAASPQPTGGGGYRSCLEATAGRGSVEQAAPL
jgi:hypothetical protein